MFLDTAENREKRKKKRSRWGPDESVGPSGVPPPGLAVNPVLGGMSGIQPVPPPGFSANLPFGALGGVPPPGSIPPPGLSMNPQLGAPGAAMNPGVGPGASVPGGGSKSSTLFTKFLCPLMTLVNYFVSLAF